MIGVFDSGVGGLTALRELRRLRPDLDIVFFADTARLPYGAKSGDAICRYAAEGMQFLTSMGAEAILVACGTVSSVALPILRSRVPVPLFGVVEPAVKTALSLSPSGKIGVAATAATVDSHAFQGQLLSGGATQVHAIPCPLFVALAENGFTGGDDPVALATAEHYLSPMRKTGIDTLILGCTHFPLLAAPIAKTLKGVKLLGAGECAAAALCATHPRVGTGQLSLFVSSSPDEFHRRAQTLLGGRLPRVHLSRRGP